MSSLDPYFPEILEKKENSRPSGLDLQWKVLSLEIPMTPSVLHGALILYHR